MQFNYSSTAKQNTEQILLLLLSTTVLEYGESAICIQLIDKCELIYITLLAYTFRNFHLC